MKKVLITEEYYGWEDDCVFCFSRIKGRTPKQVNSRMNVHHNGKVCKMRKEKTQLNKQEEVKDETETKRFEEEDKIFKN